MSRFHVILDSGFCVRSYYHKHQAREWIDRHNVAARASKARGDMVSLRYAVGIARWKPGHPVKPAPIARPKRRRKA